jgi:uncharacterized protein (TIGR01319 family)
MNESTPAPPSGKSLRTILAVDCGSTTTKAILFGRDDRGEFRTLGRGEAPTTVEAPFDDVMIGLRNAARELEDLTGRKLLGEDGRLISPAQASAGVDFFCATSSAGGGLQMMVTGLVRSMTAESAQRAALGAGAIVTDVLSADDGRATHERVRRVRHLRPDIVLVSGGVDGGAVAGVVEFAELLRAADPRPRFGTTFKLPVVYAGNRDAAGEVKRLVGEEFALETVPNIRPTLEEENLGPARAAIHEAFLSHVMSHAPGYAELIEWADVEILPTPDAVGRMIEAAARARSANVLAVDIGGATTDVFSVFGGQYHRTVSANLGMSYSLANVVVEAGAANIARWLPFEIDEGEFRDRLRNKMVRPTTVPEAVDDLLVEQAAAREALRLALAHHRDLARPLKGVVRQRTIADTFDQAGPEDIVDLSKVDLIIGSGGVLSHAPVRAGAFLMMLDAFQPAGVCHVAVDSIFMMPHLGVVSTVDDGAATALFERDCIVPLGAVVAPFGRLPRRGAALQASLELPRGAREVELGPGEFVRFELAAGEEARALLRPARGVDVGSGPGREREVSLRGGEAGIVFDCRGRPFEPPSDGSERRASLASWIDAMGLPTGMSVADRG